jgi:hypothetical protein
MKRINGQNPNPKGLEADQDGAGVDKRSRRL